MSLASASLPCPETPTCPRPTGASMPLPHVYLAKLQKLRVRSSMKQWPKSKGLAVEPTLSSWLSNEADLRPGSWTGVWVKIVLAHLLRT